MKKILFLALIVLSSSVQADNWPNWRGPNSDGVASGQFPVQWEKSNVKWSVKLDAHGGSTPAVWRDRVFMTVVNGGKNQLLCLDDNGQTVWTKAVGTEKPGKHKNCLLYTSPSPRDATLSRMPSSA